MLAPSEKTFFGIRVIARFALNGLDVVAVGLMGILGAITATGISGQSFSLFGLQLPGPTATNVVVLVVTIAFLFILKGGLAILFMRWTSVFLQELKSRIPQNLPDTCSQAHWTGYGSIHDQKFNSWSIDLLTPRSPESWVQ